jgi:phage baseplate assembly protein W
MPLRVVGNNEAVFTDIDATFAKNPKDSDVILAKDSRAIKTAIRNLLATSYGERLFQPNIGCSLRNLLFEPIDAITTIEIRDRILSTLKNHEPRIESVIVDVISNPNENYYTVNVEYSVRAVGDTDRVTVVLERLR